MNRRRQKIPASTEAQVLRWCARRCVLCFYLKGDLHEKRGQIAHLDHDPHNNKGTGLACTDDAQVIACTHDGTPLAGGKPTLKQRRQAERASESLCLCSGGKGSEVGKLGREVVRDSSLHKINAASAASLSSTDTWAVGTETTKPLVMPPANRWPLQTHWLAIGTRRRGLSARQR